MSLCLASFWFDCCEVDCVHGTCYTGPDNDGSGRVWATSPLQGFDDGDTCCIVRVGARGMLHSPFTRVDLSPLFAHFFINLVFLLSFFFTCSLFLSSSFFLFCFKDGELTDPDGIVDCRIGCHCVCFQRESTVYTHTHSQQGLRSRRHVVCSTKRFWKLCTVHPTVGVFWLLADCSRLQVVSFFRFFLFFFVFIFYFFYLHMNEWMNK